MFPSIRLPFAKDRRVRHRIFDLARRARMRAVKLFWSTVRPGPVRELESRLRDLNRREGNHWYYFIDFGYGVCVRPELRRDQSSGDNNWRHFLSQNLPDLRGKRVLDIGCNAGLYALRMTEAGASEVVGLEFDACQAEFVREWFSRTNGRDYSRARFISADVTKFDLTSLGKFDLVCMFSVAYHLGDAIPSVMNRLSGMTQTVAMQGNLPRLTGKKYLNRPHQELAGVPGMQALLAAYGFSKIDVTAPEGHQRPLVIGRRPDGQER